MSLHLYLLTLISFILLLIAGAFEAYICWERYQREKDYNNSKVVKYEIKVPRLSN